MMNIPPMSPPKCDSRCGATASQCALAEGICAREEEWWDAHRKYHADHGRGDDSGPFDPDCPCRGTAFQDYCLKAGCGFCLAADAPPVPTAETP
jgi:hypothetical protein